MKKPSDKHYLEWIRRQPSCLSGKFSEYLNGEGRNPACHVRRAKNSGTGFKAPFSCVPMTQEEHNEQHWKGEAYVINKHLGLDMNYQEAKDWFDKQVIKYLKMWTELQKPSSVAYSTGMGCVRREW